MHDEYSMVLDKGKVLLAATWAAATSTLTGMETIFSIIALAVAIVASGFTAWYYYNENRRKREAAKREKELHEKKLDNYGK